MAMQRGTRVNVKVYMLLFKYSLYYFKFDHFSFIISPNGVLSSFCGGKKQRGRERRSLFLARLI